MPQLSRLVGSSAPCVCTRLGKLADAGFCVGPKCDARARWDLTDQGRELAAAANPVLLDDLDRQVLAVLAQVAMGPVRLARRVGTCPMTAKRRAHLLAKRGLVHLDPRKFYSISVAGRQAIGTTNAPRPAPWLNPAAISAASARDVLRRMEHPNDDRSSFQRSAHATVAAAKAAETMRLHKRERQRFAFGDLDGMAG